MRLFQLLLSDEGNYPDGMQDGQTMATYGSPEQAVTRLRPCCRALNED